MRVTAFSMSIISTVFIGLLTVVTYGLPFFVGWQWVRKLSNVEENPPTAWRGISLWVGLSACTKVPDGKECLTPDTLGARGSSNHATRPLRFNIVVTSLRRIARYFVRDLGTVCII